MLVPLTSVSVPKSALVYQTTPSNHFISMKFVTTLATFALAATALAAPGNGNWKNWKDCKAANDDCVSRDHVEQTIEKAIVFLQHLSGTEEASRAAAEAIFDPKVVEYGDSINSLRGDAVRS